MLELTLRLVFSLAVVLGLLALLARFGGRRFAGKRDALIRVVHRQAISRGTAVTVVTVGSRVLVLGTTEHQVRVLAELDPEELDSADVLSLVPDEVAATDSPVTVPALSSSPVAPEPARGSHRAASAPGRRRKAAEVSTSNGALTGSVLSTDTWKQALAAATRRAS